MYAQLKFYEIRKKFEPKIASKIVISRQWMKGFLETLFSLEKSNYNLKSY